MNPHTLSAPDIRDGFRLFDALSEGVAVFSAEKRLLYVNSAMASITGGKGSLGAPLSELSKDHKLRTKTGAVIEPRDFPIAKAFEGIETIDEPYLYLDTNNMYRWLCVSCRCIRNETDDLTHVVITIRDISETKKKEDRLTFMVEAAKILSIQSSFKERLIAKARLTVPSLADWCGIDLLTNDGFIERVAVIHQDPEMVQKLLSYENRYYVRNSQPGIRQAIEGLQPMFVPVITDEMVRQSAVNDEAFKLFKELQLRSLIVVPIAVNGKGVGALSLAYGESKRTYTEDDLKFFQEFCYHLGVQFENALLYEEIKKKDAAKDVFLASLSHELRNPLSPIKSSLELLKFYDVDTDVREGLTLIEHQFDHMTRLLQDLLDVTRFTQAKIVISQRPLNLSGVVENALKWSDKLARKSGIHMRVSIAPEVRVLGDQTRLEQAVNNLMHNAIKFTPKGGEIWVDVKAEDDSAIVTIKDTGVGIEKKDLPHIFEMYYQAHKTEQSGLGLGLLLVQKIAELHGGAVRAVSEGSDRGATFELSLPLANKEKTESHAYELSQYQLQHRRFLVVDDNAAAADSLVKLLEALGNKADAAYSGAETLALDFAKYDAVLLDLGMPHMDGYATIKALHERGIQAPVVALTGFGLSADKEKTKAAGFRAHLTKPASVDDLTQLFKSIFD